MATVKNAIKKLEKVTGKKIVKDSDSGIFYIEHNNQVVSFFGCGNDSESQLVFGFNIRHKNDISDSMTDYRAGVYTSNVSSAIRIARWA